MRNLIFALVLGLAAAPLTQVNAGTQTEAQNFKMIRTGDLAKWMDKKETVAIFDANSDNTRAQDGLIPGAVALPSISSYDTNTLPADKSTKLVFYCANEACMASHAAAKRAAEAGYKSVYVLSDGIQGWKRAGKSTAPFKRG